MDLLLSTLRSLRAHGLSHGLLPLLDVILEQPLGHKFIDAALAGTDRRVREGKGVSPAFLFATLLWHEWAKERGYDNPDAESYLAGLIDRVRSGRYCCIVDYDGETPRGMVEVQAEYEPAKRVVVASIDKLFVRKTKRGTGRIALALANAAEYASWLMGATEHMLAVKSDGPRRFYERLGFYNDMEIMRTA